MTARILPFATRSRHRTQRQRQSEREAPRLTVSTEGVSLTITAHDPIASEEPDAPIIEDLRPNFRD